MGVYVSMEYQTLSNDIVNYLPWLILVTLVLIFGIVYRFISKANDKRSKMAYKVISFFSILLLVLYLVTDGTRFSFMVFDLQSNQYTKSTGIVEKANNEKDLVGTYLLIDGEKYYCNGDAAQFAKSNIGKNVFLSIHKTQNMLLAFL